MTRRIRWRFGCVPPLLWRGSRRNAPHHPVEHEGAFKDGSRLRHVKICVSDPRRGVLILYTINAKNHTAEPARPNHKALKPPPGSRDVAPRATSPDLPTPFRAPIVVGRQTAAHDRKSGIQIVASRAITPRAPPRGAACTRRRGRRPRRPGRPKSYSNRSSSRRRRAEQVRAAMSSRYRQQVGSEFRQIP